MRGDAAKVLGVPARCEPAGVRISDRPHNRSAAHGRIYHDDEAAASADDLVVADVEAHLPVQYHVDLLVPPGALVVVADHLDSDIGRAVDVDTERRQLEVVLDRLPVD